MNDDVLTSIWRRQVEWSKTADRLKSEIVLARATASILAVAGAVASTMAATVFANTPDWRTGLAASGAVCLALATFVASKLVTVDALRSWTRARSVSEAIKSEVFTFRANAAPYAGADALDVLQTRTNNIVKPARDLERHVAKESASNVKPPPPLGADYVTQRVEQQITHYYRRKAKDYAGRLRIFRVIEFLLGLAGTALGALATYFSAQSASQDIATTSSAWVAVLTTIGAAVGTHMVASRYDFLVMSYYGTAARLEELLNECRSKRHDLDPERWSGFVRACEEAISVENESWLAKWMAKEAAES